MGSATVDAKRARIQAQHEKEKSWAKVADKYPGVKRGTLHRFGTSDYEPKKLPIRRALGISEKERPDYDSWKARNMAKLLAIVAWAETPAEERQWPPV